MGNRPKEISLLKTENISYSFTLHLFSSFQYPDLNNTTYPNLSKTVFVIFMIFVPILLLNMLIAMMGNTYAQVIERSEKEWMKQVRKLFA